MEMRPMERVRPFGPDGRTMSLVLVDDDASVLDLTAECLLRELDGLEITALTDPGEALEAVVSSEFDCIVSDYDMPGMDGLDLLTDLRARGAELPFVLFTGKGSEEIASRAISAGVDEYLQKGGTEEYPVLANKIENVVEKHWAEEQVNRAFLAIESAEEGIGLIDADGTYRYLNEAYADIYDRDRASLVGEHWETLYPPREAQRFEHEILPALEREGVWRGVSTGITKDGETVSERLVLTQMADGGHVCIVQRRTETEAIADELSLKNRALDAAEVGVVITDARKPDDPIAYANDGFLALTGYDREEIIGRNCRFLQGPGTDPDTAAAIRSALDAGESISTTIRNYDATGSEFRNHLDIYPIRNEDGDLTHHIGFQRTGSD